MSRYGWCLDRLWLVAVVQTIDRTADAPFEVPGAGIFPFGPILRETRLLFSPLFFFLLSPNGLIRVEKTQPDLVSLQCFFFFFFFVPSTLFLCFLLFFRFIFQHPNFVLLLSYRNHIPLVVPDSLIA